VNRKKPAALLVAVEPLSSEPPRPRVEEAPIHEAPVPAGLNQLGFCVGLPPVPE
jgi:hypothetical protein